MKSFFSTILLTLAITSFCCDTPVFRYSMERWTPSPYQVKVLHSRDLTAVELQAVKKLKQFSVNTKGKANTYVEVVDLRRVKLPSFAVAPNSEVEVQVSYPIDSNLKRTFIRKPLNLENTNAIIDSPIRQKLAQHLTNGSPAVWLLLESSNESKNSHALKILTNSLKEQEIAQMIPRLTKSNGTPTVTYFPIVKVDYKNIEENFLRQMLLSVETDLLEIDEPIVFPIYGQGRGLFALVGDGINPKVIKDHATFVMGNCSCIVKEQNPGVDMLFNCDWTRNLGQTWVEDEPAPQVGGFDGFIETIELPPLEDPKINIKDTETVVPVVAPQTLKVEKEEIVESSDSPLLLYLIIVGAVAILVIGAGTIVMRKNS